MGVKVACVALLACVGMSAHAALGGSPLSGANTHVAASVMAAAQVVPTNQAANSSAASAQYTVNSVTLDSGTVVREYVATSSNIVFALTWDGPAVPNLREILGDSFTRFVAPSGSEAGLKVGGPSQRVLTSSDLVASSVGHAGHYRGYAYLPALVPAGFSPLNLH